MMYLFCAQIAVLIPLVNHRSKSDISSNLRSDREVYACQTDSSIAGQLQKGCKAQNFLKGN